MVRVLGIGDNTVDIYVDQGVQFPGGNAVNVAVLMKRLGAEAAYLGCVGTDFLGGLIRDALMEEGVDLSKLRIVEGPNSWSRIRHIGNDRFFDGSRPSLRDDYRLGQADFDYIASFDLAHSSIYSRLEDDLPRIGAAAPILSFDYSSGPDAAYIKRTAPAIDIAFFSAPQRSSADCLELAREVASHGPSLVVVTRGANGVLAFDGNNFLEQSIVDTELVDTLGAGDGFIAGFLTSHLASAPLAQCLLSGAQYAARVCAHRGAFGHETPIQPGQPGLIKPQPNFAVPTSHNKPREEDP
jgi:fructoselysine 6-kinase